MKTSPVESVVVTNVVGDGEAITSLNKVDADPRDAILAELVGATLTSVVEAELVPVKALEPKLAEVDMAAVELNDARTSQLSASKSVNLGMGRKFGALLQDICKTHSERNTVARTVSR